MKKLAAVLLTFTFAYAQLAFNGSSLPFAKKEKKEHYCIKTKFNTNVCYTYKEITLNCTSECDNSLREILNIVKSKIKRSANINSKEDLQDWADEEIDRELYDKAELVAFSQTPNSVTFAQKTEGYSGGAHGYYGTTFINIDKKSHKIIKFNELFKAGTKNRVLKIAEKYYKIAKNIPLNTPIEDADNWDGVGFKLADNFAITNEGIYFYYNPYEVGSYAFGSTDFLLPYEPIKDLIDPNSPMAFALEKAKSRVYYFEDRALENYKNYAVSTKLEVKEIGHKKVELNFEFNIKSDNNRAWISFSFPQFRDAKNIKIAKKSGFKNVKIYNAGSKIYNIEKQKAVRSKYLLVEGEPKNSKLYISFIVNAKNLKELLVDFRVVFKDKKMFINFPYYTHDVKGQQGFNNYRVVVPIN